MTSDQVLNGGLVTPATHPDEMDSSRTLVSPKKLEKLETELFPVAKVIKVTDSIQMERFHRMCLRGGEPKNDISKKIKIISSRIKKKLTPEAALIIPAVEVEEEPKKAVVLNGGGGDSVFDIPMLPLAEPKMVIPPLAAAAAPQNIIESPLKSVQDVVDVLQKKIKWLLKPVLENNDPDLGISMTCADVDMFNKIQYGFFDLLEGLPENKPDLVNQEVLLGWLKSMLHSHHLCRKNDGRLRRLVNPGIIEMDQVVELRKARDQSMTLIDDLLMYISQKIQEYGFIFKEDAVGYLGGLYLGHALDEDVCTNVDMVMARHLLEYERVNISIENFREGLYKGLEVDGAVDFANLLTSASNGFQLEFIRYENKEDMNRAKQAAAGAMTRGDLNTMDWIITRSGDWFETEELVDAETLGRSCNAELLVKLCGASYQLAMTVVMVDAYVCEGGLEAYFNLWKFMPHHMDRLFGSPKARVPYAWPLCILEAEFDTLEYLYSDGVLEFSDLNLNQELIGAVRVGVFRLVDDLVFSEESGWIGAISYALDTPQKPVVTVKRRRITTASRAGSRQRSSYDASKSTKERLRVEAPLFTGLATEHLDKEIMNRIHVLYDRYLSSDDSEEQRSWFHELWTLCWFYSRSGVDENEDKIKILLYVLEQIPYSAESRVLNRNQVIERILEDSKNIMILTIEFEGAIDLLNDILKDANTFWH